MNRSYRLHPSYLAREAAWWIFLVVCVAYGVYALVMGGIEILARLGVLAEAPARAVPWVFVVHALTGGVALIAGVLQFNRRLLTRRRALHRILGRVYVGSIWLTSLAGLWSAIFFDVSLAARIVLALVAVLWFATTTIAFVRVRQRQIQAHREWMIRSFALSFFFVTFSFWVPGLASTNLPEAVSYPLAILLSWSLNLLAAEGWIRYTRSQAAKRRSPKPVALGNVERLAAM